MQSSINRLDALEIEAVRLFKVHRNYLTKYSSKTSDSLRCYQAYSSVMTVVTAK